MNVPASDDDRERAAQRLQQACGQGILTLDEFSVRVGKVWAAQTRADLTRTLGDLPAAPVTIVGTDQPVERVVTVFGESRKAGRWRLSPQPLHTVTVFGSCEIDLRGVLGGGEQIEITGGCFFGELRVLVPEGVEVRVSGPAIFASRTMRLAPVPRLRGTPLITIHVTTMFGSVEIESVGGRH